MHQLRPQYQKSYFSVQWEASEWMEWVPRDRLRWSRQVRTEVSTRGCAGKLHALLMRKVSLNAARQSCVGWRCNGAVLLIQLTRAANAREYHCTLGYPMHVRGLQPGELRVGDPVELTCRSSIGASCTLECSIVAIAPNRMYDVGPVIRGPRERRLVSGSLLARSKASVPQVVLALSPLARPRTFSASLCCIF